MSIIETTITEHIYNRGKVEGKAEARAEGIQSQIATLYSLHDEGILSEAKLKERLEPLIKQLNELKTH
jgi:hypothetical protein